MVLRGHIDFKTDPWPKLSDAAKDCVTALLQQDPTKRANTQVTDNWHGQLTTDGVTAN